MTLSFVWLYLLPTIVYSRLLELWQPYNFSGLFENDYCPVSVICCNVFMHIRKVFLYWILSVSFINPGSIDENYTSWKTGSFTDERHLWNCPRRHGNVCTFLTTHITLQESGHGPWPDRRSFSALLGGRPLAGIQKVQGGDGTCIVVRLIWMRSGAAQDELHLIGYCDWCIPLIFADGWVCGLCQRARALSKPCHQ